MIKASYNNQEYKCKRSKKNLNLLALDELNVEIEYPMCNSKFWLNSTKLF